MPGPRETSRSGDAQRRARLSRLLALVLRHRPDEVGLTLDEGGFAPVEAVARALAGQRGWELLTTSDLLALADADPRRYAHMRAVPPEFLLLPDDLPEIYTSAVEDAPPSSTREK
jgi:RNA:NAD 2'-phosphotransferase (TPT1/KptA family)